MRKKLCLLLCAALLLPLGACAGSVSYADGVKTYTYTDSAQRDVELPEEIKKVAPSGAVATMILSMLAPEDLVCISGSPSSTQYKYLPAILLDLPTTGQLYGTKSTLNLESLLHAGPQVVIDLGDPKAGIGSDLNALQRQTGVACVYVRADLPYMAEAFRSLGELLDKKERAEEIAGFIDKTIDMAENNSSKLSDADKITVMYARGTSGQDVYAAGSIQAQVLDVVAAKNAAVIEDVSDAGGNTLNMEQIYLFDPDVILFTEGGPFDDAAEDSAWQKLRAVQNDTYYEIPDTPYCWMSGPPSVNMVLGIWWLGNLLYPELYDYDMVQVAQEAYRVFWNYDLSQEEAAAMLANSTLKRDGLAG